MFQKTRAVRILSSILAGFIFAFCVPRMPAAELIHLPVVAYNNSGQPIPDLHQEDIDLSDAGRPRQIVSMQLEKMPPNGSTIILFDLVNQSDLALLRVKNEITQYLRQLASLNNVEFYVLTRDGEISLTGSKESGQPITPEQALDLLLKLNPDDATHSHHRLDRTIRSFENLAQHLSSVQGRKSIIWVTHGLAIDLTNQPAYESGIPQLCNRLVSNSITVYAVHESEEVAVHLNTGNFLQRFTALTGGVVFPAGQVAAAIAQARKDGQATYSVSFQPTDADGKFHKIQLRSHQSGVRLRTVDGYYPAQPAN